MKSLTRNDKITTRQLCILLIMCMRVGIPGTNIAYLSPYHGGFVLTHATACLLLVASIIPFVILSRRFGGKTPYEYSSELLGKPLGKVLNALLILVFIGIASSEARPTANLVQAHLLPATPSWITSFFMIFTVFYLIRSGINALSRVSELFFIVSLICLIVIILMAIPYIDISYFQRHLIPPAAKHYFSSSFSVLSAFFPLGMLLFFAPFSPQDKRTLPSLMISTGAVSIVFITFGAISVSIFGTVLSTEMFSPLTELSKIMGSDTSFFPERSTLIFMLIYKTLPQFINCCVSVYIACIGLLSFFPKLKVSAAAGIVSAVIYFLELIPTDSEMILRTERFWDMFQFAFLPLTLLLLFIAAVRKKPARGLPQIAGSEVTP